jgi:hypothetical protein
VPTYELIDQTCEWIEKLGSALDPAPTLALGMKGSSDFDGYGAVTVRQAPPLFIPQTNVL